MKESLSSVLPAILAVTLCMGAGFYVASLSSCTEALATKPSDAGGRILLRGSTTHHYASGIGDTTENVMYWPLGQRKAQGVGSFRFEQHARATEVASCELYFVPFDRRRYDDPVDWLQYLIDKGGPSREELVPVGPPNPQVRLEGDVAIVEPGPIPMPDDSPMYLVLKAANDDVVESVLFGPLYEDASGCYSTRRDLLVRRK